MAFRLHFEHLTLEGLSYSLRAVMEDKMQTSIICVLACASEQHGYFGRKSSAQDTLEISSSMQASIFGDEGDQRRTGSYRDRSIQ